MRNTQLLHAQTEVIILSGFDRSWQECEPEVDYNLLSKEITHLYFTSMHIQLYVGSTVPIFPK